MSNTVLLGKAEGKRTLGRRKLRWRDLSEIWENSLD